MRLWQLSAEDDHAPVAGFPFFQATDPGIFMERGPVVELRKRYAQELLRSQQEQRCGNIHAHAGREGPIEVCEIRMGGDLTHEVGALATAVMQDRHVRNGRPILSARPSHKDMPDKGMPIVLHPWPGENEKRASFADRDRFLTVGPIIKIPTVQGGRVEGF